MTFLRMTLLGSWLWLPVSASSPSKMGTSQPQAAATNRGITPVTVSLPELQSPEGACHVAVSLHQGNSVRGGVTAVLLLTVAVSKNLQLWTREGPQCHRHLVGHLPTEVGTGKSGLIRSQRTPGTGLEMFHLYSGKEGGYILSML